MIKTAGSVFLATILLASTATAFAGHRPKLNNWTEDVIRPEVSPAEARASAEHALAGTADNVRLDRHSGVLAYRVDLVAGTTHREVIVDASSGSILGEHLVTPPITPIHKRG